MVGVGLHVGESDGVADGVGEGEGLAARPSPLNHEKGKGRGGRGSHIGGFRVVAIN